MADFPSIAPAFGARYCVLCVYSDVQQQNRYSRCGRGTCGLRDRLLPGPRRRRSDGDRARRTQHAGVRRQRRQLPRPDPAHHLPGRGRSVGAQLRAGGRDADRGHQSVARTRGGARRGSGSAHRRRHPDRGPAGADARHRAAHEPGAGVRPRDPRPDAGTELLELAPYASRPGGRRLLLPDRRQGQSAQGHRGVRQARAGSRRGLSPLHRVAVARSGTMADSSPPPAPAPSGRGGW